jgi:hypothetical protein
MAAAAACDFRIRHSGRIAAGLAPGFAKDGFAQVSYIALQHLRRPTFWLNYMQQFDDAYLVCKWHLTTRKA